MPPQVSPKALYIFSDKPIVIWVPHTVKDGLFVKYFGVSHLTEGLNRESTRKQRQRIPSEYLTLPFFKSVQLSKGKATPVQPWAGNERSRRSRLPDFKTIGTLRLLALRSGRLYPPGNIPGTHFC